MGRCELGYRPRTNQGTPVSRYHLSSPPMLAIPLSLFDESPILDHGKYNYFNDFPFLLLEALELAIRKSTLTDLLRPTGIATLRCLLAAHLLPRRRS